MRIRWLFLAGALALLAACASPPLTATPTALPSPSPTPAPPQPTPTPSEPVLSWPGVLAIQDLAARLGVQMREIELAFVESGLWPDASLGCPQPGQAYAQVVTPGYRIVLRHAGKRYDYHTDHREQVLLCSPPVMPPPSSSWPGLLAIRNLAARLGVPERQIGLAFLEWVLWPDTDLGCPQPGVSGRPIMTPGYRIILAYGEQLYEYRTDLRTSIVLCSPLVAPAPAATATAIPAPAPSPDLGR